MEYLLRELVLDPTATGGLFRAEECGACTDTQTDCGSCTDTQTDCGSCTDGATDSGNSLARAAKSRTTCAGLSRFDDLEQELERALSTAGRVTRRQTRTYR